MSGTELIMGMGEVINYLKGLEEENKKLKEQNEAKEATIRSLSAGLEQYKQENKKLKRANEINSELHKTMEETIGELEKENKKLKNKLNVSEVKRTEAESELESFQDFTRDYDYEDNYNEWLKGNHDNYSGSWMENWYSEHFDKYEDGDDWDYGYGFTIKNGEYRIHMAGGGDHWEDYVMDKNGCFIHNKEGKKKVFTFVSCPEGNYIKVWDTPDMEGGLVLDEGETDMYEMVKECFVEEIMNYEKEEDHIPTDSDEEEDPDCCESCGKSFDLQYTLRHADKELSKKYQEYMGSPEDCGDICEVCIKSPFRNKKEEIECGECSVCGNYHSEYDPCGTNCAKPEEE